MTAKQIFLREVKLAAQSAPRLFFAPLVGAISGAVRQMQLELARSREGARKTR